MALIDYSHWKRATFGSLALFIVGAILIGVGELVSDMAKELLVHIGTAFIVAGLVSIVFDLWYHKSVFGDPVRSIQDRVKEVGEHLDVLDGQVTDFKENLGATRAEFRKFNLTIETFAQVLQATQANGIVSIFRRLTDEEKYKWKVLVSGRLQDSTEFIFLMGRTFFELLPLLHKENGIRDILLERGSNVPIVVVLPDTYDRQAEFRRETELLLPGGDNAAIYTRSRYSLRQFLDIANECRVRKSENKLFAVRLLRRSLPFALMMTEKSAIVEPYLPYKGSGEGLIFEIKAGTNLYQSYKECFQRLFLEALPVDDVLREYVDRKPDAKDRYQHYLEIAADIRPFGEDLFTRMPKLL